MKYSKRYIAFGALLAVALLLKFYTFGTDDAEIGSFRGANLDEKAWNPLIAASVNANLLSVVIIGNTTTRIIIFIWMRI